MHESEISKRSSSQTRILWIILFLIVLITSFVFSIIQPPTGPGDEGAHMQYIKFLANEHRLPVWEKKLGGEAGYESQHPPLYYAVGAVVYSITDGLAENWQWYLLRWMSILIGAGLFLVARRFSLEYFNGSFTPAYIATAAFLLTPTTLLHMSYVNVDIASVFWCSLVLLMCLRLAKGTATKRDRIILAVAFGAGMLTKLTALGLLPLILISHFLDPSIQKGNVREQRLIRLLLTLMGAVVIAGWCYVRNNLLYKTPFIHTAGRFGSGFYLAENSDSDLSLIYWTLRETYLSIWAQRGWLDPGLIEISLYGLLTLLIILSVVGGITARRRMKDDVKVSNPAPLLCIVFLATLFLSHQMQVWCVDFEFNAGGRYILNGLMGLQALIVAGLFSLKRRKLWLTLWVTVFLVMNIVSVHRILTVLNPKHYPDWQVFQIPSETPQELVPLGTEW